MSRFHTLRWGHLGGSGDWRWGKKRGRGAFRGDVRIYARKRGEYRYFVSWKPSAHRTGIFNASVYLIGDLDHLTIFYRLEPVRTSNVDEEPSAGICTFMPGNEGIWFLLEPLRTSD